MKNNFEWSPQKIWIVIRFLEIKRIPIPGFNKHILVAIICIEVSYVKTN